MKFAHEVRVARDSAKKQCCYPKLVEPPVKRHSDRLAARSGCTSHSLQQLDQVAAASSSSPRMCGDGRVLMRIDKSGVQLADAEHLHVADHCLISLFSTCSQQQLHSASQARESER